MRHSGGLERPFPLAADSRDGTVGPTRVHSRSAAAVGNAQI